MQPQIDRTQAPLAGPLNNISLPDVSHVQLFNGVDLHMIQHGNVDVVTLQAIFKAGKGHQAQAGLANFTARNMQEGTHSYTGLELARKLDEYGGWLGHNTGEEYVAFQLTTLSENVPRCLELIKEVMFMPVFPEDKFENMRQRTLQKLSIESQKTRYQAKRLFGQLMFGQEHPYGMHVGPEQIEQLSLQAIRQYHQTYFYPGNYILTAVGKFKEGDLVDMANRILGADSTREPVKSPSRAERISATFEPGRTYYDMEGMQATIRLGHPAFNRSHPDFYGMQIVNTILGGYFGSRLMQNIREEKGYTYGIYSGWVAMANGGYFVVQSDIGNEYIEPTIEEVRKEMNALAQEPISGAELNLVKNYLLGRSISERETPFQLSDILRFSLVSGISFEELDRKFEVIRQIQPEDIQRLAAQYFRPDALLEVVCGKQV